MALSLDSLGSIEIYFNPCGDQRVTSVKLLKVVGKFFGDENDELLWSISSTEPMDVRHFTVGQTPSNYIEEHPYNWASATGDVTLGIQVYVLSRGNVPQGFTFRYAQLRPDLVMGNDGKYMTLEKFESLDTCQA